jgi:hypothetical protein
MAAPPDPVDEPVKIWVARAREILNAPRPQPQGVADDSGLKPGGAPQDKPASQQGTQMDLAAADVAAAARVKKADDLRRQIAAVTDPDEAGSEDLQPLEQARQAARAALDTAPLTEAALGTAAQELLCLQAARKAAAAAILQRLRALVETTAQPLQEPSLKAPPDAEGAEWKGVDDAVGLATKTRQDLLASEALRSGQITPLQAQVQAALQARDLALQAIQQRLRKAADELLAQVQPATLVRVADASDSEWKPVADLVADVRAALDRPSLGGEDLRAAETRLQDLGTALREVRNAVRERLAREADEVRIKANLATREIEKQRKSKLASAEKSELQVVDDYLRQLDDLTKPKTMSASQIAQAQHAVDGQGAVLGNVLALAKAREALLAARTELHADVRREVEGKLPADPAVGVYEKLRAEVAADPATDRSAALGVEAQNAVKALKAIELACLKDALKKLTDEARKGVGAELETCVKQVGSSTKDAARIDFATLVRNDPTLVTLSTQLKELSDKLAAAAGYGAALKSIPTLVDGAKRRGAQLLTEQRLSAALVATPSASGKSVDERMNLLRALQADVDTLRRDIHGVAAAACKLPAGDRLLLQIETLEQAMDGAQAATLETDCSEWRKKLVNLRSGCDADITALRVARATATKGAKYLKEKSKLYNSGGTPPSRGEVEAAMGASADPGYTLAAWGYTWDALLAEIRSELKDGRMTQEQLDKLEGGTGGQRYVKSGSHHISISFTKDDDMFLVTSVHVSLESAPEKGRPRYWYSVNKGVVAAKPSTTADPNPSGKDAPANFTTTADNLVTAHKSKFNCK